MRSSDEDRIHPKDLGLHYTSSHRARGTMTTGLVLILVFVAVEDSVGPVQIEGHSTSREFFEPFLSTPLTEHNHLIIFIYTFLESPLLLA